MPSIKGQGQSEITEEKERGFQSFFEQNLAVVKRKFGGRFRYFHFDLHSGCGVNREAVKGVEIPGSPIVFSRAAQRLRVPYIMHAIDRDKDAVKSLGGMLKNDRCSFAMTGDNSELLAMAPHIIREYGERPEYAVGSVLLDPNAFKGQIPWDALSKFASECPRIDVMLNYNGFAYFRDLRAAEKTDRPQSKWMPSISSIPAMLGKRFVSLREPLGVHRFILIACRNTELSKLSNFAPWGSPLANQYEKECEMDAESCRRSRCGQRDFGWS